MRLSSNEESASPRGRQLYDEMTRRNFLAGDHNIISGDASSIRIKVLLEWPIHLGHLHTSASIVFRREQAHIRNDKVGSRLFWFVKKGALKMLTSQGSCVHEAGHGGFINSDIPFSAVTELDDHGIYEAYQAIIPPDVFLANWPKPIHSTGCFSLEKKGGNIIDPLLSLIFDQGQYLTRHAAHSLVDCLVGSLVEAVHSQGEAENAEPSIIDRRLGDIENYIFLNLTNPELSLEKVARGCGLSPRSLCYLLKACNTSFADLLWKHRLYKAQMSLISPGTCGLSIREVAFLSGFKNAAHFSRMFKAIYRCTPKEYRASHLPLTGNNADYCRRDVSY